MKTPKYIDSGKTARFKNKHDDSRWLIIDLKNEGVPHKEIASILMIRHGVSTTPSSLSQYCARYIIITGAKKKKKIMSELHSSIKRLYLSGMDEDEISYALSSQENEDYTKQAKAIAKYIKNKGFKRPGQALEVCKTDAVQSIKLITSKWTATALAEIAA